MELFQGQLNLHDILHGLPYKILMQLRDVRIKRIDDRAKQMEEESKRQERESVRNTIMKP